MIRKSAAGSPPPTILEALEPRIAPAIIYVGTSNPNEGYSQSAFTKAANSPDPAIASLFAGSADHYYLTLDSKSPVKFGDGAADYITVSGGKALVFFYDKNGDGKVGTGEISGLSLGAAAAVSINDSVGGDVLGTFNAQTNKFSATNLQPDAKSISKLAISGSVDGSIVAAGSISNVAGSFPAGGDPTPLKSADQISTSSDGTFIYNLGGTNVGQYTSSVVDATGTQHIAYYDAAAGNLKYAKGSGSSWTFQTIDSTGDVGQFTSIALTSGNNPVISYYDVTNGDLKLATFSGVTWSIQTVDPSIDDVGQFSSLVLKSDKPQVAYYDKTAGHLDFASYNGSAWTFTQVDPTADDVGQYASLAYDAGGDILHTSYHDATTGTLKYAQSAAGGVWVTQVVDAPALVTTGLHTSIAVDPSSHNVGISYIDSTTQSVHYVQGTSGGIFAPAAKVVVQAAVGNGDGQTTSLAFSATGPAISYAVFDSTSTPHLKYAERLGGVWSLQDADTVPGSGGFSSLAFDSAGNPHIALHDTKSTSLTEVHRTGAATWATPYMVDGVGVGTLAAFTPDTGKAGGSISAVTIGAVDKIVAGPGGAGGVGGSISNATIVSDTNGFDILGGAGGAGKTGGNGGSVTGVLVYGAVEASGTDVGTIKILGGDGASVAGAKAGAGGAASKIYVGYQGSLASPVVSTSQLLNDKVIVGGGKGGSGAQGGAGASLSNISVSVATLNQAGIDEISIFAGAGGAGTSADGIGGGITTALLENKNDKVSPLEKDDIRVQAGNAGDGAGNGAAGGSVSGLTTLSDHVSVFAGNGSAGTTKAGAGGSVSAVTVLYSDLDRTEALTVVAGAGGAVTKGNAGNGGSISGITGDYTDLQGASLVSAGDGGTSSTGKGGIGGAVANVKLKEPGQDPTLATLSILGGHGGAGSAGGGIGGSVSQIEFFGMSTSATLTAGTGGSATVLGAGGAGGGISDAAISSPSAASPLSLTAGNGGSGAGKSGSGGVGGSIKHANADSDPDITFTAGNGGGAGAAGGKSGLGGALTSLVGNSNIGSVSMVAGSAASVVPSNSASAGGSISSVSATAAHNVSIIAGNGAWGGVGGNISGAVWYGITARQPDQTAAPSGDIQILAGQGSANAKLAGAGGSISNISGYASAGVANPTHIYAGDGNGGVASVKGAAGGSITGVSLFGGSASVDIRAGHGGSLTASGTGGTGGSISAVNLAAGVVVHSLAAGDGGSSNFTKGKGGLGGSVTKVNAAGSIGTRGDTGLFTSTAVDGSGNQDVAFYDATNGDLKYYDGKTGIVKTVDSVGDVGEYASLKLTIAGEPVISYYDATNGDLKLAQRSPGDVWTIQTVATAGDVGEFSSLVLTTGDLPRISYYNATTADLQFASSDGVAWTFATIDSTGDVGRYSSLAIDSSLSPAVLHVSYFDASDTTLKYAQSSDIGITVWKTVSVDDPDFDTPANPHPGNVNTGYYTSIAVNPDTHGVGISYFDTTTNSVHYAAGSADGVFLSVDKTVVATGVGNGPGQSTSVAFDTSGTSALPIIAFQKFGSTGTPTLQLGVSSVSFFSTALTWATQTAVADAGSGAYASLVFDSASGTAFISSHNTLNGSLQTVTGSPSFFVPGTYDFNPAATVEIAPANPFGIDHMGGIFTGAGGNAVSATGLFTSTAVDATGLQHISYYDPTHGDLKYAVGSGTTWTVSTVDSTGNVGQYTSIALDSANHPVISYYDATNGDLKLATYTGAAWSLQTVNNTLAGDDVGQFTSLKLKADKPQVSYYDASAGELEFASYSGSSWTFTTVDTGGISNDNVGKYDSLAYDASGDIFHISYQDVTSGSLKYARSAAGGVWTTQTIDLAVGVTTGLHTSIAIDPVTHDVGISYINATGKALDYVQGTSAGVFAPADKVVVKTAIGSGAGQSTSLAFGSTGSPKIAYGIFDTNGSSTLHAATRTAGVWADAAADSTAGAGQYASLAFDASGNSHVAQFSAGSRTLTEVHQPAAGGAWSTPATVEGVNIGIVGKAGNVTDVTAKAISSIVAGREVSPQLVSLVDRVYLRGLAAPTVVPGDPSISNPSGGSFTTVTDPNITHPTVNFFDSNIVGGISGDPTLANANQFKFVGDAPANAQSEAPPAPLNPNVYQWALGITQPLDGLVAAIKLTSSNKNFTPQATLMPVNAKVPVKPTDPWVWSPTGYALADYRNNFTFNS